MFKQSCDIVMMRVVVLNFKKKVASGSHELIGPVELDNTCGFGTYCLNFYN